MKNKRGFTLMDRKGLSEIIATLIIILLVLVAIGIIWVVVRNIVQSNSEEISLNEKCLDVEFSDISVVNVSVSEYKITATRTASGDDSMVGLKVVFHNDTTAGAVLDTMDDTSNTFENLDKLQTGSALMNVSISNPNKITYNVYFKDSSGNDQICRQKGEFSF